jgi:hypothetical protein
MNAARQKIDMRQKNIHVALPDQQSVKTIRYLCVPLLDLKLPFDASFLALKHLTNF